MEREKRRSEVFKLLKLGTDEKRAMGSGYSDLVDCFTRALELATEYPPLPEPFPAIIRYRLAMVLFERANTRSELEDVVERLEEVATAGTDTNVFGMMPSLYQVAALYRLAMAGKVPAADRSAFLGRAFRTLREAGGLAVAASRVAAAPVAEDLDGDVEASLRAGERIQTGDFNLLELAARFIGAKHPAPGTGPNTERCPLGRGWTVVGSPNVDSGIVMSEEFARAEFSARRAEGVDVAFELYEEDAVRNGRLFVGTDAGKSVQRKPLLTLALLCQRQSYSVERLQELTALDRNAEVDLQVIRTFRSEFRKFLKKEMGEYAERTLLEFPEKNHWAVHPDLRVVGLVEVTALPSESWPTHA